ncbi:solute carrier family 2, facilitated glucose transporter member 8-like [Amblyomma americanum]
MEALRNWRPAIKGATPTREADDPLAFGRHERAMMVACLSNLSAGTALGYASTSMPYIERESWYDLERSSPQNRWAADVLLLGAAAGALLSGCLKSLFSRVLTLSRPGQSSAWNSFEPCGSIARAGLLLHLAGHRRTLLLSAFGLVNAWICLVVSNSVTMLFVGRVACGLWLGVTTNSASLYVCDVSPPIKRSLFGGLAEVATSVGMLTTYMLGGLAWQIKAGLLALLPVPVFVLQSYVIESPRWLQSKGRYRDTNTAIVQLYGDDLPTDFRLSKIGEDSALSSLGRQKCTRMLSVCLLLNLLQTLSCSPLLLLRAVQVVGPLQDVMSSHEAATLVVAMHVGSAALFTVLTRCVGRRLLLGASAVLVAVVLSAMQPLDYMVFSSALAQWSEPACRQWSAGQKVPDGTRWDALCSTWLLALTYSVGLCHVPPLLTVELLPLKRWRYLTSSCVWTGRWLLAFALVHCDDELFGDEGGDRQQPLSWAFSLALVLVTAAAAFFAPHTEGRPLADIHRDE